MANDHRVPPKPPWFDTVPEGTCKWCNKQIGLTKKGQPSKSRWHPTCVKEYKLLFWPTTTRRAVLKRDKGVCRGCGVQCSGKGATRWHMDHIQPLIEAQGNMDFWRLGNLQTLCTACHKEKTSREATERAEKRKLKRESDVAQKDPIK